MCSSSFPVSFILFSLSLLYPYNLYVLFPSVLLLSNLLTLVPFILYCLIFDQQLEPLDSHTQTVLGGSVDRLLLEVSWSVIAFSDFHPRQQVLWL